MLERIIAQLCVSMLSWLDGRMSRQQTAVDAQPDREALRRAGHRLRDWLRRE